MTKYQRFICGGIALMLFSPLILSGCLQESVPHVDGVEVSMDDENFQAEALESEIPVLVDFGAAWCGPCRQMEPAIAYLSVQYKDRVKVGKVDVDESTGVASEYDIRAYPTFVIFQDGQEIARTEGGRSYKLLSSWLDEHITR